MGKYPAADVLTALAGLSHATRALKRKSASMGRKATASGDAEGLKWTTDEVMYESN